MKHQVILNTGSQKRHILALRQLRYYLNAQHRDRADNLVFVLKNEIHFVCIDKRFRDNQSGAIYVVLENQQKLLLPPQITKVPAMLLLKEGNAVIFGKEIEAKIKPQQDSMENH